MSIHGPLPPSSIHSGFHVGGPQLHDYAQASLATQLAAVAPTSRVQETHNMTPQEQNTFWFLRIYADMGMLGMMRMDSVASSGSIPAGFNAFYVNDLKFILSQVQQSNTGFDPAIINDLNTVLSTVENDSSPYSDFFDEADQFTVNYNAILQGQTIPGYGPNSAYSFTENLSPDDMFNFYLIQIANVLFSSRHGQYPPNDFWSNPSNPNQPSLLGSQFAQFMCYYFVQRDGQGAALKADLTTFNNLFSYCCSSQTMIQMMSTSPALQSILENTLQPIADLANGTWDASLGTPPDQDNDTPPPAWDTNSYAPPWQNWSYGIDYNFLFANDMFLGQWIQEQQLGV
jgi:hypothetical protein